MLYAGRPGISPVLASLLAAQQVRARDRVLDVGCGTGTDALLLAAWGFRHVDAIDPDARAVGTARARAKRRRLGHRVRFHHLGAERLAERFPAATFDVVLHTLVANNLTKEKERHFRSIASVMKPNGLLVLQERVTRRHENARPGAVSALGGLRRHFRLTRGLSTHLPERRASANSPGYARVVLWLGRPRVSRRARRHGTPAA